MSGTLLPTGSCFDDAMAFLHQRLTTEPGAYTRYVLVHAMIVGPNGQRAAHAWVENPSADAVYTTGIADGRRVAVRVEDKQRFYDFLRVHDVTVYSVHEAQLAHAKHGHPPPWEARYRALCGAPQPGYSLSR